MFGAGADAWAVPPPQVLGGPSPSRRPLFTLKVLFPSSKLRDGWSRPTFFRSCRLICSDKEGSKMCTICHQMLTIASASGAPPVLPRPSCGTYDVPHSLLIALTQSLAMHAASGPSLLVSCSNPTRIFE